MRRIDRLDRRILHNLPAHLQVDIEGLAEAAGCTPEVAADRVRRMLEDQVLDRFEAVVSPEHLPPHQLLVVGVPTERTTEEQLEALADVPGVARVFTMAAHASVAFVLQGDNPRTMRREAGRIASDLGIEEHQGILVIRDLHERRDAGAPWTAAEPEALRQRP